MKEDTVEYQNGILKIQYLNYGDESRNYGDLFDFLGDYDVITASELGNDVIIMSDEIFLFSHQDEWDLRKNTFVELQKISSLDKFVDNSNQDHINFVNWYRGI